jgi:hypothetical protein
MVKYVKNTEGVSSEKLTSESTFPVLDIFF